MSGTLSDNWKEYKKNEGLIHDFCLELSGLDRPLVPTVNQPSYDFEGSSPSSPPAFACFASYGWASHVQSIVAKQAKAATPKRAARRRASECIPAFYRSFWP
jgi:hypothetical protein